MAELRERNERRRRQGRRFVAEIDTVGKVRMGHRWIAAAGFYGVLVGIGALACSSSSSTRSIPTDGGAGTRGSGGSSGESGSGGISGGGTGGTLGAGGNAGDAGSEPCSVGDRSCVDGQPYSCGADGRLEPSAPCGGATPYCVDGLCVACTPDTRRCEGTTPQLCDRSGSWISEPSCTGPTPICNPSTGICTGTRVWGGITTTRRSPASGSVRLRQGELIQQGRACAGANCVSGGIRR
jgi:hypothetical protein